MTRLSLLTAAATAMMWHMVLGTAPDDGSGSDHGHGDGHGGHGVCAARVNGDDPMTCTSNEVLDTTARDSPWIKGLKDPIKMCMQNVCNSDEKRMGRCLESPTMLTMIPDTSVCEGFFCICRNGGNNWNPVTKTCTVDERSCLSALKEESCETEYKECVAGLNRDFINNCLDTFAESHDDCKPFRECLIDESDGLLACHDPDPKGNSKEHACHMHEHAHGHPVNIIVLTGMLALGNFCRYWKDTFLLKLLPYTVQVFLIGAAWGALCMNVTELHEYGKLGEIDPHLLFHVFLPILIFESAFATHHHVFKEVVWHCVFLAGPGLITCSALTAVAAKYFFTKYNWTWVACLLFGCILSATDPVAVVALLKELGAAPAISQLIEGESLLNDGTAIVFFVIFQDAIAEGRISLEWWEIILNLIKIAGGGVVLGALVGKITVVCIKRVFNDAPIEITLTLVAAYFTFFCAEVYLGVSGVLGLVIMGMYVAFHGHVISPEVEHSLHHFWEIIVYMGNTFIFAIAGIVIAEKAFNELEAYDGLYLVICYLVLNVVRGFGLAILLWPMNKIGYYQLDVKNAILCTWGGLRGAVGLALALIILGNDTIRCSHIVSDDPEIREGNKNLGPRFLFHVAGIVIGTLCVNGVTTGWVVRKLGLDAVPVHRKRSMRRLNNELKKNIDDEIYNLRREPVFRNAKWTKVIEYTSGIKDPHTTSANVTIPPQDLQEDACQHYYRVFAKAVEHEYENGTMYGFSLRLLLAELAKCEQLAHKEPDPKNPKNGGKWTMIEADFLEALFHGSGKKKQKMVHAFDTGIGFLNVHDYVQSHIVGICHNALASNRVIDHCKRVRRMAIRVIDNFTDRETSNKEIAILLKSRNAARGVLNSMRQYVGKQCYVGKVMDTDAAIARGQIEDCMRSLKAGERDGLQADNAHTTLDLICPQWYGAHADSKQAIQKMITTGDILQTNLTKGREGNLVEDNKNILGKTNDGQFMMVILSGVVRVDCGMKTENFGAGYIAGLTSVLTGKLGRYTGVYPESRIEYLRFPAKDIRALCQRVPQFAAALWDELCRQTARKVLRCEPTFADWTHVRLKNFVLKGRRYPLQNEAYPTPLPADTVCILVCGEWKDVMKGTDTGEGPALFPRHLNAALFKSDSVLFAIESPLTPSEKARQRWGKIKNKLFTARAIATLQGHEAGVRAVREVLSGKSLTLFGGRGDAPPPPPMNGAPPGGPPPGGPPQQSYGSPAPPGAPYGSPYRGPPGAPPQSAGPGYRPAQAPMGSPMHGSPMHGSPRSSIAPSYASPNPLGPPQGPRF
eukprot:TRINITY_DN14403_c0_g5_i1.p1 TRINITY_DN14403_c0_g5~~TRINITY_DN14403_c0_g5_i1.p1  ORF type:complete len:1302 (+),score=440.67 TRINITY_DN14403_c0_g5_i1:105-4010(+)